MYDFSNPGRVYMKTRMRKPKFARRRQLEFAAIPPYFFNYGVFLHYLFSANFSGVQIAEHDVPSFMKASIGLRSAALSGCPQWLRPSLISARAEGLSVPAHCCRPSLIFGSLHHSKAFLSGLRKNRENKLA